MKTIERLRELLKSGTQEPWEMLAGEHQVTIRVGTAYIGAPYQKPHGRGACPVQLADGRLMVEGRNALPALLAVVEAAAKVNKALCHGFDAMAAGSHEGCIVAERATYTAQRELDAAIRALEGGE